MIWMRVRRLPFIVMLAAGAAVITAQEQPEYLILRRALAAVEQAEPQWRFLSAIMNTPKLMDVLAEMQES